MDRTLQLRAGTQLEGFVDIATLHKELTGIAQLESLASIARAFFGKALSKSE